MHTFHLSLAIDPKPPSHVWITAAFAIHSSLRFAQADIVSFNPLARITIFGPRPETAAGTFVLLSLFSFVLRPSQADVYKYMVSPYILVWEK